VKSFVLPTRGMRSIALGTLSSGQCAEVVVHELIGAQPGPTLALLGGLHGDEPFAVDLVRRILDDLEALPLRGTVTAIPCANPLAFQSMTRNTPVDMLDLNRVFPGDPDGTFSNQLADAIYSVLLDGCEFLIDFHSGGAFATVDYVRGQSDMEFARSLKSKLLYAGKPHVGSVSDCFTQAGRHTAVVEVGGGRGDPEPHVQRVTAGVHNSLRRIGMLEGEVEANAGQTMIAELKILRPHHGGVLISNTHRGDLGGVVAAGYELGRVLHVQTLKVLEVLSAPFEQSALILVHDGTSPIGLGDFAYIVGRLGGTA
jgi:predicted deacylase